MKVYKRYSAAKKAANGEPIIRVGDVYLVGVTKNAGHCTEIAIMSGEGRITGTVTARNLDRLGNANWAVADPAHLSVSGVRIWEQA